MDLYKFVIALRDTGHITGYVPDGVLCNYRVQGLVGMLLYREGQFQVEQWLVPPNYIIPEHTHPNVESYEMYIGGDILFSHNKKWVRYGQRNERGMIIHVKTSDVHGGAFGPNGGIFISVQKWADGIKPHTITNDWDGISMGDEHPYGVKKEVTDWQDAAITWQDAATEESQVPVWP